MQQELAKVKYDDAPSRWMLYPSIVFLIIALTIGVFLSYNVFLFPDYFSSEYIQFGRLRPVHVGTVAYLWLVSANVGLFFYLVPRLCGVPLWSYPLAYISIALWWASLAPGIFSYPFGTNFGWEYAELPDTLWGWYPVKFMVLLAWIGFTINLYMTIATRTIEKMYVSLWYVMGTMFWTGFTYVVGSYAVNWVPEGISRVNVSWFYVHNLVGLIFTPQGLAIAYFFLPKVTNSPIYSHQLSMVGFWSIAFVYAWVGAHHMIHGPISQWLQTTSIVFSIALFIPVWTVVGNFFYTLRSQWNKYEHNVPLRFILLGAAYYFITCVQGPLMSLRNINELTSKTDWIIGHAHISIYGTFTYFAFAGIYYALPSLASKPLWSRRMASWHFALNMWGGLIFMLPLWLGGFLQGMQWSSWADGGSYAQFHNNLTNLSFLRTIADMYPWWTLRSIGGTIVLFGNIIFAVNVFNTILLDPSKDRELALAPAKVQI